MQNTIKKFRQGSIAFEKPGILPENLKTITILAPTILEFNILCWNFAHVLLANVHKIVCGGFFILFRSWFICKN